MTTTLTLALNASLVHHALRGARSSGLFAALGEGPASVEKLAEGLDLDPSRLSLFVDALVALGVLEGAGAEVRLPALAFDWEAQDRLTGTLEGWLHGDEPFLAMERPAVAATSYPGVIATLATLALPVARATVEALDPVPDAVLEVGAGGSPWGRALAARGARVTALDLPPVLEVTRSLVEAEGLSHAYSWVPADALKVDLDRAFDLVVCSGFLRLLDPTQAEALVARLYGWTRPGGQVLLVEAVRIDPVADAGSLLEVYALGLALRTTAGGVRPASTYAHWLRSSGFRDVAVERTQLPEISLLWARRPDPRSDTTEPRPGGGS